MAIDGIRAGENTSPSDFGLDPLVRGKIMPDDRCILLSLDVTELGTNARAWNDKVHHRSSLLSNGVDRLLCGGQEPGLD